MRQQYNLSGPILLLLTNPIDDQGLCTTQEKYALIRRFIEHISPLLVDKKLQLVIKLHGRESLAEYQKVVRSLPYNSAITILFKAFNLSGRLMVIVRIFFSNEVTKVWYIAID